MTAALLLSIVVLILVIILALICNHAAGRWHDLKDGEIPLKGIPVLTEYVNKVGRYHGFRVDTYSTKRQEWVEATAWDQEVIRYAEIKQPDSHDHD
jgi:hypothetical protein